MNLFVSDPQMVWFKTQAFSTVDFLTCLRKSTGAANKMNKWLLRSTQVRRLQGPEFVHAVSLTCRPGTRKWKRAIIHVISYTCASQHACCLFRCLSAQSKYFQQLQFPSTLQYLKKYPLLIIAFPAHEKGHSEWQWETAHTFAALKPFLLYLTYFGSHTNCKGASKK